MKKYSSYIWLGASLIAALACAAVRLWQNATAFEGRHGLPIFGAPASVILLVLLALTAFGLFALAQRQPISRKLRRSRVPALYAPGDNVFLLLMICAAFLLLLAAPFLFVDGRGHWLVYQAGKADALANGSVPGGNNGLLMIAAAVMSALSCLGMILTTKAIARGAEKGRMGILLPVVNNCLWLMELYRGHAAEPVRWGYGPMLICAVAGIFFYLNCAGMFTKTAAPRRTLWLAGMTIVTSAVALAGEWDVSSAILAAAQILTAAAVLWCMPNYLIRPPEISAAEIPAEEKLEEKTHE